MCCRASTVLQWQALTEGWGCFQPSITRQFVLFVLIFLNPRNSRAFGRHIVLMDIFQAGYLPFFLLKDSGNFVCPYAAILCGRWGWGTESKSIIVTRGRNLGSYKSEESSGRASIPGVCEQTSFPGRLAFNHHLSYFTDQRWT